MRPQPPSTKPSRTRHRARPPPSGAAMGAQARGDNCYTSSQAGPRRAGRKPHHSRSPGTGGSQCLTRKQQGPEGAQLVREMRSERSERACYPS